MNRVLISGATGNIGRKLVSRLLQHPHIEVVPCFRKPQDAEKFAALGLSPVLLDMDDPVSAAHAVQGINTLFLLKPYTIRMLMQSKIMLDAAHAAGVRHVIHLGAFGADDTPWATIGWNHMVERYIEALGFDWTHLRPNFFMDNLFRSARSAEGIITHFISSQAISWISCDDIAAVAAAAILDPQRHRQRTWPLAVERCSMPELAVILSELTGRSYRYEQMSAETGFKLMTGLGREAEFVRPWLDYMAAVSAGDVPEIDAVFDTVQELTNCKPVSLRDFISANLARFT